MVHLTKSFATRTLLSSHLYSLSHCRSTKTAFAAARRATAEFPLHRADIRRALKHRIRALKLREAQAKTDRLAELQARHANFLDYTWQTDHQGRAFRVA